MVEPRNYSYEEFPAAAETCPGMDTIATRRDERKLTYLADVKYDSYDGGVWLGAFFIGGGENVIEIVAIAGFVVGIGVVSGAGVASSVKNGCLRLFYINARRLRFFR